MSAPLASRKLSLAATFILCSGFVGCTAFNERLSPTLTAEVTPADGGAPAAEHGNQFTVEIRSAGGKVEAIKRPLSEQLCVQEALEKTGALKKFGRFNLELHRPTPSGSWHRMELEWDRNARRVPPESDYGILAGDRLIVMEDPADIFDDIAEAALKPLGMAPKKKTRMQQLGEKYRIGD